MIRLSNSLSDVPKIINGRSDERKLDDEKTMDLQERHQKDWYGGGLWLRSANPNKDEYKRKDHNLQDNSSSSFSENRINDQRYVLEKGKHQLITMHTNSEKDIKTARTKRSGGLWRKDQLPQLLNAVLEIEEGNFVYKYNVPYDTLKRKNVGNEVQKVQTNEMSRIEMRKLQNEKKNVRGPRVGRETNTPIPYRNRPSKVALSVQPNVDGLNMYEDQWHIAPRAGKDLFEVASVITSKGIGHSRSGVWNKNDDGLWKKREGGLLANENNILRIKKEGGLWAKKDSATKNGGLWAKRNGGLWVKKDTGSLLLKKSGGLWAKKDGGLWSRKDGLWANKDGGIWLWKSKDRTNANVHTTMENDMGVWSNRKESL